MSCETVPRTYQTPITSSYCCIRVLRASNVCASAEVCYVWGETFRPYISRMVEARKVWGCALDNWGYITYWREKFRETPIEQLIPAVQIDSTDKTYFLLSSLLKEDKELRHKIKLDHAIRVQEFERTDANYKRSCLFCKLKFEGKRPDFLEHVSSHHNLQLGNPQNLVFIEELVEKIDAKLKALQCIYCDKTFPERFVLKEHMRKKLHKRINPQNRDYDKYYMVNYLEPDKSWKAIQKERDCYAVPVGSAANSDEEYSDWNEQETQITCLFCDHKETDVNILCLHMETDHDFDFADTTETFDFYQKIKLVNYIRRQVHNSTCVFCEVQCGGLVELRRHMLQESHCKVPKEEVFNQPEFYFPTYENDAFLYYIDDVED